MGRVAKPLGALAVGKLAGEGYHAVGTVPGLCLQISKAGARSWILRTTVAAKRREIGLGAYPAITLQMAHQAARDKVEMVKAGHDPVDVRKATKSALTATQAKAFTFKTCALDYIKAHEPSWTNLKHAQQWRNTLATYAYPVMGSMLVRDVDLSHVLAVIQPLWGVKTETATRVRSRIECVLDWAITKKYRDGLNPARWKGNLDNVLPSARKVSKVKHHAALPVDDVADFMTKLRLQAGTGARALEFSILTAARSGETRGATWAEIDLDAATWTIPGTRMKAGREHKVPLSQPAIDLLKALPRMAGADDLVFVSPKNGQLSDMTLTEVTRRMKAAAVPHGFRSTFRDWASETTNYPSQVAEMALAHTIGDAVEAAYRRGDLFEKRTAMMADWAEFLSKPHVKASVVPIRRAA
jgi:integrase